MPTLQNIQPAIETRFTPEQAIKEVRDRLESGVGPDKILIDIHGQLTAPADRYDWQYRCCVVLVRGDGYSIGCNRELYQAARQLCQRDLVAVICYANTPHKVVIKIAR